MKQQISYVQRYNALAGSLLRARMDAFYTMNTTPGGIEIESSEDRSSIAFDQLQGEVVYALFRNAVDIDALLDYIQFVANAVKREGQEAAPVVMSSELPAALTAPGVTCTTALIRTFGSQRKSKRSSRSA